jgi:hypothetical protein
MTSLDDITKLITEYADDLKAQQKAIDDAALADMQKDLDAAKQRITELEAAGGGDTPSGSKTLFGAFAGQANYPNTGENKAQMRARILRDFSVPRLPVERIFNEGSWTVPAKGTPSVLSINQNPAMIASGSLDAPLDTLLKELKANGDKCWFTAVHEADNHKYAGPDMVAAYKHIQARRDAVGANNVLVGPILMSYTQYKAPATVDTYCYDGMDFLGFDAYFRPKSPKTAETVYGPCIAAAKAHGVPMVIGETSVGMAGAQRTDRTNSGFTEAEWTACTKDAVDYLKTQPTVQAVCWFEVNKSDGDWRLTNHPEALKVYRAAMLGSL